jgi:hypothetical protein
MNSVDGLKLEKERAAEETIKQNFNNFILFLTRKSELKENSFICLNAFI